MCCGYCSYVIGVDKPAEGEKSIRRVIDGAIKSANKEMKKVLATCVVSYGKNVPPKEIPSLTSTHPLYVPVFFNLFTFIAFCRIQLEFLCFAQIEVRCT